MIFQSSMGPGKLRCDIPTSITQGLPPYVVIYESYISGACD
jgi:hypothetical protein